MKDGGDGGEILQFLRPRRGVRTTSACEPSAVVIAGCILPGVAQKLRWSVTCRLRSRAEGCARLRATRGMSEELRCFLEAEVALKTLFLREFLRPKISIQGCAGRGEIIGLWDSRTRLHLKKSRKGRAGGR